MDEKKYYYALDGKPQGPYTLEELKEQNITRETLIWYAPLPSWKSAHLIPELDAIWHSSIPQDTHTPQPNQPINPIPQGIPSQYPQTCPPNYLVWSILATIFCCWPLGIPAIIYASRVSEEYLMGNYLAAKENSDKAKRYAIISTVLGIVGALAYLIFMVTIGIFENLD